MEVSDNYGYHFGGPAIIRTIVYWGFIGVPILGNYHKNPRTHCLGNWRPGIGLSTAPHAGGS